MNGEDTYLNLQAQSCEELGEKTGFDKASGEAVVRRAKLVKLEQE